MEFIWDDKKNNENLQKHNISFEEAILAFDDPRKLIVKDIIHSATEHRYYCVGDTGLGIATVRFTLRGNKVRVFGAGYWRKEKRIYNEYNKNA